MTTEAKSGPPPNVLLLSTSFPTGGSEVSGIFVGRLATHLADHARIHVLTPCPDTVLDDKRESRYELRCFRYAPRKLQVLAHQPGGIPAAFRSAKPRLLLLPGFLVMMLLASIRAARHCEVIHANWSICGAIGGLAGKLTGKPVITTLRGQDVNLGRDSRIFGWLADLSVRLSDRTVGVSRAIVGQMGRRLPKYADRLRVIPNGVDPELLELPIRRGSADGFRLLFIGSLIPLKNVDRILRALAQPMRSGRLRLEIVGDGPERQRLEAIARETGVEPAVTFHGRRPPHAIVGHLAQADTLVLASSHEGRPNVVLEAMAAGVPVIAADIEGVSELITGGETGLLFSPDDPAGLRDGLARLMADPPLREDLAVRARAHIVGAGLLWTNTARQYASLYREVTGSPCVD